MGKAACKRVILHERILRAYHGPAPVADNPGLRIDRPGIGAFAAKPLLALSRLLIIDSTMTVRLDPIQAPLSEESHIYEDCRDNPSQTGIEPISRETINPDSGQTDD